MINKLISLALLLFFLTAGYSYSENQFVFPKKKPSVFKKIETNIASEKLINLPQKKPIIQSEVQDNKELKKMNVEKKKIETQKNEPVIKKELKPVQKKVAFLLPQKKPMTYKIQSKKIEKSTVLNQKDFEKAKETIKFIKARKWNSALKSAKKVKDIEFRTLISWMHLKTTQNSATFNDYKNFIEQHEKYPRINRIKYLAETKIYLRNN
jgi:soluble lytic murein transglycosylase